MPARILLIDDDTRLTGMVRDYLQAAGLAVSVAGDLAQGRLKLQREPLDALVLDLMLPDGDGLDLTRELRADPRLRSLPLLMLTARGEPMDRIIGLELGADDYVAKPCTPRELTARIRAILSRAQSAPADNGQQTAITVGQLIMWPEQRRATWAGNKLELTSTEFNLLEVLARNAGRPVSKNTLSEQGLGRPLARFDRNIDVHLSSLRHKLGTIADGRSCLQTVYRLGYQLIKE